MNKKITRILVLTASLIMGGCQVAPVVHGQAGVVVGDEHSHAHVAVVFSDNDRRHIRDYYHARYEKRHRESRRYEEKHSRKKMPPGLTKREKLPPGLEKREQLPPGLAKRDRVPAGVHGRPLPSELERRLSRLPAGVSRVRVGAEIVLINDRTRVVLDVIKDIPLD